MSNSNKIIQNPNSTNLVEIPQCHVIGDSRQNTIGDFAKGIKPLMLFTLYSMMQNFQKYTKFISENTDETCYISIDKLKRISREFNYKNKVEELIEIMEEHDYFTDVARIGDKIYYEMSDIYFHDMDLASRKNQENMIFNLDLLKRKEVISSVQSMIAVLVADYNKSIHREDMINIMNQLQPIAKKALTAKQKDNRTQKNKEIFRTLASIGYIADFTYNVQEAYRFVFKSLMKPSEVIKENLTIITRSAKRKMKKLGQVVVAVKNAVLNKKEEVEDIWMTDSSDDTNTNEHNSFNKVAVANEQVNFDEFPLEYFDDEL
ncbi:hypothetical protein HJ051_12455 [Vibrio parahaemolyticus]|nr:hypothetical protein [Vibrio parahaemolyticus]